MKHKIYLLSCVFMGFSLFAELPKAKPQERSLINIGLNSAQRAQMSGQLNGLLANEYVLYTKTQKFHWNVKGPFFGPLHCLFGKQYEELAGYIDMIAERVRALGNLPIGTLTEFLQFTTISEAPGVNPDDKTMIRLLLKDHEIIIRQLRKLVDLSEELHDMGSNNFLADLLEKHEKTAWMLRAHLEK